MSEVEHARHILSDVFRAWPRVTDKDRQILAHLEAAIAELEQAEDLLEDIE